MLAGVGMGRAEAGDRLLPRLVRDDQAGLLRLPAAAAPPPHYGTRDKYA
jgi:hypothetical protein